MLQGYKLDLQNEDGRNLYYLNKAIKRFEAEIASVETGINKYARTPEEQRSLLADALD